MMSFIIEKVKSHKFLVLLDYDLSPVERKHIPIPLHFPNHFELDRYFVKDFYDQISDDTFREYFNVPISPQEIPTLAKYFHDL